MLVLCIVLIILAEIASSSPDSKLHKSPNKHEHHNCQHGPQPIRRKNHCKGLQTSGTVDGPHGPITCQVPSKEQLLTKLKDIGGANPFYVAATEEEALNFPNLLPNVSSSNVYECYRVKLGKKRKPNALSPWWSRRAWARRCHKEYPIGRRSDIVGSIVTSSRCVIDGTQVGNGRRLLCNRCHQVRQLPTGYFPSFFNELSCGGGTINGVSSDTCDGGFGECSQNHLKMPILRYAGDECKEEGGKTICKQQWNKDTANLRSCCECQLS